MSGHPAGAVLMCWHGFKYPTKYPCPTCGNSPLTVEDRNAALAKTETADRPGDA